MKSIGSKLSTMLGAHWFYIGVLGFFVFEALWFVFSAVYPMAFDEEFHFGIIQLYTRQWSPHIAEHPPGGEVFGAVARDPSFFFHYLMSFPLRVIALFADNQTAQIMLLRLINVGLFTASLVLFRQVLLRAGMSQAFTNTALAVFVLIPITPQLAAHINYDNLLMLLVAWAVLAAFSIYEGFKRGIVNAHSLALLVVLCILMAITKYAALPLVAALTLFVAGAAYWFFRRRGRALLAALQQGYRRVSTFSKIAFLAALLVGLGLFAERYGGNMLAYHTPLPQCDRVLSVQQCLKYGPWERNYRFSKQADPTFRANPINFLSVWLSGMHHRLYFAVNGVHDGYTSYRQLPVPAKTAATIAVIGSMATVIWWRQVFRGRPYLVLFLLMIIVYGGVLWVQLYSLYASFGEPVAINGRYLLPVLLPLAAIMGTAMSIGFKKMHKVWLKPYVAAGAIVLLLYGGGVFTFILRSDPAWYWPNQAVHQVNHTARTILQPIIIEGEKYLTK